MNYQVVSIIFVVLIVGTFQQCDGANQIDCLKKNNVAVPLLSGKCCWENGSCKYKDKLSFGKIKNSNLDCGTQIESCAELTPTNSQDRSTCIYTQVESPYKCCFIKHRYFSRCFPINNSEKKEFKKLEYQMRTYYGWEDAAEITIDCNSYFTKISALLLTSFLFLL